MQKSFNIFEKIFSYALFKTRLLKKETTNKNLTDTS